MPCMHLRFQLLQTDNVNTAQYVGIKYFCNSCLVRLPLVIFQVTKVTNVEASVMYLTMLKLVFVASELL